MLFRFLRQVSPVYSQTIHDLVEKPFAIGKLKGDIVRKKGLAYLKEGQSYQFALSGLNKDFNENVERLITAMSKETFDIGSSRCCMSEASVEDTLEYSILSVARYATHATTMQHILL